MWGVTLTENGLQVRSDLPKPCPAEGEILVRVLQAGICETDLQLVRGYMNFRGILGHEFVGIAEAGRYAGGRVVGEINNPCRRCPYCTQGLGNHCPHRTVLGILNHDGAFAEYVAVPQENLHPVPESLSLDQATFTEPLAAACQILQQIDISPSSQIIVLGDGRLGNLCAQVLNGQGGAVTVIGKHPEKLRRFASLGIPTLLLDDATFDRRADVVVDCTGSSRGIETALRLVKPRGTIVMKTTVADTQAVSWAPLVIDEITLVGSRCGPFDEALRMLENRQIDIHPLITARYPLREALTAFDVATQPQQLKVLLEMEGLSEDSGRR
ncbi:MAG: alcohol dehydrogenase catalytic domain-containing protein [Planctomycetota bacterium]|nr:alcohol dehydrogenase catalytic domain-containing protein [Planctomycetota bacterium]MDA1211644.1 alcohol dehydrogenase catalytic domain-containing protein [Planctomycetota bacterium]